MSYFYHFLRIFIGLAFIVSGLAKLFPIEPFENTFIELGVSNWLFVPFIARVVIAFELFIGISIVLNVWLQRKTYYLAQCSLIAFTGYLIYLLFTKGNNVSCGCFGSLIELSPLASIGKNVLLMVALFFIPKQYYQYGINYGLTLMLAVSMALPIVLNPIGIHNVQGIDMNEKIDFSGLPSLYKTNQQIDFLTGKKVVAFFSYKCSHCINAAKKFTLLNQQQKITNLYYVVGSKKEEGLITFIEKTNAIFPIIWMKDDEFFKYSGGSLPAIVYLEKGVVKKKWIGDLFDVEELKEVLSDK